MSISFWKLLIPPTLALRWFVFVTSTTRLCWNIWGVFFILMDSRPKLSSTSWIISPRDVRLLDWRRIDVVRYPLLSYTRTSRSKIIQKTYRATLGCLEGHLELFTSGKRSWVSFLVEPWGTWGCPFWTSFAEHLPATCLCHIIIREIWHLIWVSYQILDPFVEAVASLWEMGLHSLVSLHIA